jgi:hypothetical protein
MNRSPFRPLWWESLKCWRRRSNQRELDLQRGVDAGLVRANERRWRLSTTFLLLAGLCVLTAYLTTSMPVLQRIVSILAAILFIIARFLNQYYWAERATLHKPDPEKPPSIFKK